MEGIESPSGLQLIHGNRTEVRSQNQRGYEEQVIHIHSHTWSLRIHCYLPERFRGGRSGFQYKAANHGSSMW